MDTEKNNSSSFLNVKLQKFRKLLTDNAIDGYIVFCADTHNSEYTGLADKRLGFISGYTGSAGTALITKDKALIFTDGRYWVQAERQIESGWEVVRLGLPNVPSLLQYIWESQDLINIGIDSETTPLFEYFEYKAKFRNCRKLKIFKNSLVDTIWAQDRPAQLKTQIYNHPLKWAGTETSEKLEKIYKAMLQNNADALLISSLDEVAWTLNMRAMDVPLNPVFYAYMFFTKSSTNVYINEDQLSESSRQHLDKNNISICPYNAIFEDVAKFCDNQQNLTIWIDPRTTLGIYNSIPNAEHNALIQPSPIAFFKAIKNDNELEGFRQAHVKDGIAHVKFFHWLEKMKNSGEVFNLTEYDLAHQVDSIRSKQEGYVSLSFGTISAIGANGAIAHYNFKPEKFERIKEDIYLLDSAAQYESGTTDLTRTIHLGQPTNFQKEMYTCVLKGHIEMAKAIFPQQTKGPLIDVLARKYLNEFGLNYFHGTGHGVGAFLHVHEGPMKIDVKLQGSYAQTELVPGMVLSNEPGYYDYYEDKFGIRIENLVYVKKVETKYNKQGIEFYGFEDFTMCPIDTEMIDLNLMTQSEIEWLDNYHEKVYNSLLPMLTSEQVSEACDNTEVINWLKEKTKKLK